MARESKISVRYKALVDQYRWFIDHGGCKAAYVERYGSANDPNHYGNGGEAIYEADAAALMQAFCAWTITPCADNSANFFERNRAV
jgi:hypothetical protein